MMEDWPQLSKDLFPEELKRAERAVVGAVFLHPPSYEAAGLTPQHFFDVSMGSIWEALGALRLEGKPIDELTVADKLGPRLDACGGLAGISAIVLDVPTTSNVSYYADMVREGWLTRRVISSISQIRQEWESGTVGELLLEQLHAVAGAITRETHQDLGTLHDVLLEQIQVVTGDYKPTGLPSGLGIETYVPGGIPRNKVTMLFADTATFKSTVKNQLVWSMISAGHRVLDVSLEDTAELTSHRVISRLSGVPYGRISGGTLSDGEKDMIRRIDRDSLGITRNILPGDTLTRIDDIIRSARQCQAQGGLSAVIVDYIQILDGKGKEKDILDEAIKKAARASKADNVAYIFLSQVKQDVTDRDYPRPMLRDMLGSSTLKNACKLALALFKPSGLWRSPSMNNKHCKMYAKMIDAREDGSALYPSLIELWILKNVLGPADVALTLHVDKPTGRITSFSEEMDPYHE